MRNLGNIFLLGLAVLIVLGVSVFRTQIFSGFQRSKSALMSSQPAKPSRPPVRPPAAVVSRRVTTSKHVSAVVAPKPNGVVTVDEPKQAPDSIEVGMGKATLHQDYPPPAVMISSRDGHRFRETYIYLVSRNKATVVRVVNDLVTSVRGTRTVDPPLLVSRPAK